MLVIGVLQNLFQCPEQLSGLYHTFHSLDSTIHPFWQTPKKKKKSPRDTYTHTIFFREGQRACSILERAEASAGG